MIFKLASALRRPDRFGSADRRLDTRHVTVFRPALITVDDFAGLRFEGLCMVRNISSSGFMGSVHTRLPIGQRITLQTHFDLTLNAQIVWADATHIGAVFDTPVDIDEVLAIMSCRNRDGMVQRAPRVSIRCKATLSRGEEVMPVEVLDMSQSGVKIAAKGLKTGEIVNILVEGLDSRRATVQWSNDGRAGLTFFRAVRFEELASWAIDTHQRNS